MIRLQMILFMYLVGLILGQEFGNQGKVFIIGFTEHRFLTTPAELFIATVSDMDAEVNISTPLYDATFLRNITVTRGQRYVIEIDEVMRGSGIELSNKAIQITSSEDIVVFGHNYEQGQSDGFLALPVDTLGTEYVVVTWTDKAEFMIIATQDQTQVSITFPATSEGASINITYSNATYLNGDTWSINMNKYETLHVYQDGADFTGTWIQTNKPVAVLSGNKYTEVKDVAVATVPDHDHLLEQLIPVDTWGKEFFITGSSVRLGEYYRVVASQNETTISTVNLGNVTINAFEYIEINAAKGSYQTVSSDKPVMVVLIGKSFSNLERMGDSHMSIIPPVSQFESEYTWSTMRLENNNEFENYVILVIEDNQKNGLYLDNGQLNVTWFPILGSTTMVTGELPVSPGLHYIYHNTSSTFMTLAIGHDTPQTYSFPAGMKMNKINEINGNGEEDATTAYAEWGNWDVWNSCSKTCGQGTMVRQRICNIPESQGGSQCTGDSSESKNCNDMICFDNKGSSVVVGYATTIFPMTVLMIWRNNV